MQHFHMFTNNNRDLKILNGGHLGPPLIKVKYFNVIIYSGYSPLYLNKRLFLFPPFFTSFLIAPRQDGDFLVYKLLIFSMSNLYALATN